jgi:hypothetical protein
MTKERRSIFTLIVVCAVIGAAFYTQKQGWFHRDNTIHGEASPTPRSKRLEDACTITAQKLVSSESSDALASILAGKEDPELVDFLSNACSMQPQLLQETSREARFFNALLLGRLIDPMYQLFDYRKSFDLLTELYREDPKNGAYPYFRAAVRQRQGELVELIRKDLVAALSAPVFDAMYLEQTRKIHRLSIKSPSYFLVGRELISRIKLPDFIPTFRLFEQALAQGKDPAFDRLVLTFGERLMKPAIDAKGAWEMVRWSALEYSLGRKLGYQAWQALHPKEEPPAQFQKSASDIAEEDPQRKLWTEAFEQIVESSQRPGVCDDSKLATLLISEMGR